MKEENLIFIVSQPRAGSTYLQNLLSNNEEVNTCSEPWVLLNFANMVKPALMRAPFEYRLASRAFQEYVNKYPSLEYQKKQKEFLLDLYKPMADGFTFVIDKTPRYWELLDEIVTLFPKSRIIILKRNPIDVVKSMVNTWNLNTIEKLCRYKRDLLIAPKKLYEFSDNHENNPNIYSVKYEELIHDTAKEIDKLYRWVGVSYTESVLDVSANNKYKGKFGDNYQNSNRDFNEIKKDYSKKPKNKMIENFIAGYNNYLGNSFLKKYGDYNLKSTNSKRSISFSYFMYLCKKDDVNQIDKITWIVKKRVCKLFKFNL